MIEIMTPGGSSGPKRIRLEDVHQEALTEGKSTSMADSTRNVPLPDINVTRLKSHRHKGQHDSVS